MTFHRPCSIYILVILLLLPVTTNAAFTQRTTPITLRELDEVRESGSTSEEEEFDDFVMIPKEKKPEPTPRVKIIIGSPSDGGGNLTSSRVSLGGGSGNASPSMSKLGDTLSSSGSFRFPVEIIDDYKSSESVSLNSGIKRDGSAPSSRSGSGIFSGSRSRYTESPQSLSGSTNLSVIYYCIMFLDLSLNR